MSLFTCAKDTIIKEVRSIYRSNTSKRQHQKGMELERKLEWNQNDNATFELHNKPKQISRQIDEPNDRRTN